MATLPYITSPGNIDKALNAIKNAAAPTVVSQDFVKTILKIPGGSGSQMTTFLKKMNFADTSGKPTELYTKFRNPNSSGRSVAKAIRYAYAPLYVRNEFMHKLSDDDLVGLIIEETGQEHDSNPVKLAFACIKALKNHADFTNAATEVKGAIDNEGLRQVSAPQHSTVDDPSPNKSTNVGLNLGYTINLNLPATSDQAVFNAIFKSLKEHLLRDEDA